MGKFEKEGEKFVFRQDDGEVSAWFDNIEEKMVLSHEGIPQYKKVFYLLVLGGMLYLAAIFFLI